MMTTVATEQCAECARPLQRGDRRKPLAPGNVRHAAHGLCHACQKRNATKQKQDAIECHPVPRLLRAVDDAACAGRAIPVVIDGGGGEETEDLASCWKAVRWNFDFQEDYAWGPGGSDDGRVYPETLGQCAASFLKDLVTDGVFVSPRLCQRDYLGPTIEALAAGAWDEAERTTEQEIARLLERCHSAPQLGRCSPACELLMAADFDWGPAADATWSPAALEAARALPEGDDDDFWPAFAALAKEHLGRSEETPDRWKPQPLWRGDS